MLGMEIGRKAHRNLLWIALGTTLVAIILGVLKGPKLLSLFAGAGLCLAALDAIFAVKETGPSSLSFSAKIWNWIPTVAILGLNFLLLFTALLLQQLFLTRLSDERLKIPPLRAFYQASDRSFNVKLPVGWKFEPLTGPAESGIRLVPDGFGDYMGAAEIQIRVRKLEKRPANKEVFLKKFTSSIVTQERAPKKGPAFQFSAEPGVSMGKETGVWTTLDVTRLWIPIRQTTFFGIKNGQYLCSVSATGIQAHATLQRVMALGLYETLLPDPSR